MRPVPAEHYENFPVASLLCPPALREPVMAIYRFARTADDLADEGDIAGDQRLASLAQYRRALDAVLGGGEPEGAWAAVFEPLALACRRHALPGACLHALLDAFEQDVRNPVYADRAALLDYCRRSANPVGRLLLQLYAIDEPAALEQADCICSALQLINFWQDLSVDLPRGRVYVPESEMRHHAVSRDELLRCSDSPRARAMIRALSQWAAELMARGAPLCRRVPGRAGWELRLVVQGGFRILEKIAAMNHDSLRVRPLLRRRDWPLLLWRAGRMV